MEFDSWAPVYSAMLEDFGYPRADDEAARDRLATLLEGNATFDPAGLDVAGKTAVIVAPGPNLEAELDRVEAADVVIAASTAVDRLQDVSLTVDCMVTDLDKNATTASELTQAGVPVVAHAHGDNIPAVAAFVADADPAFVVPTTQAAPTEAVHNFGGFTDGDRAAFLADHLGAASITFAGWDLTDDAVGQEKRRKLRWAERLLRWLETRRDERFSVLDGRRDDIEPVPTA